MNTMDNKHHGKPRLAFFALCGVIAAVVLFCLIMIAVNKLLYTNYDSLSSRDQSMLAQTGQVLRIFKEKGAEIWTEDYCFEDTPLLLVPVDKEHGILHSCVYAVGGDAFAGSATSVKLTMPSDWELPDVYRVSAFDIRLLQAWLPFNFTFFDIGDDHEFLLKYYDSSLQQTYKASLSNFQYLMIHEGFHEYRQVPVWKNADELPSSLSEPCSSEEQLQMLFMESVILEEALYAKNETDMRAALADFIAVRTERRQRWPGTAEGDKIETLEGTAEYAVYAFSRAAGLSGDLNISQAYTEDNLLRWREQGYRSGWVNKDIFYYTGALEGLLLDRLGIQWHARADGGELIYGILAEACKDNRESLRTMEEIKERYQYDKYAEAAGYFSDGSL